jgi:hypothetical protein
MVSFGPGDLPIDNLRSVNHDLAIAVNTPPNFNDETGSICLIDLLGDLNDDCEVNLLDLAIIVTNWLSNCFTTPDTP